MLIALGFLGASLLSLLVMPYVWRNAVKATAKRLQFAAPDSVMEVQADRDQLRAEHALAARKLELEVRDLKEKLSQNAVEQTRANASVEQLRTEIMEKDTAIAEANGQNDELRASMSPMETELASRTGTVQQLRDQIRTLEDRVREQDFVIRQASEAAGLKEADIELLRATMREEDAKGPPLPMEIADAHEDLSQRLEAFRDAARTREDHRRKLVRRRQSILKLKEKLASSNTISAREAKTYQARIGELDAEQTRLADELRDTRKAAAGLRKEVNQLDAMWQDKLNPYHELREKIDAAVSLIDQSATDLENEGDLRSMLAAIPGGKADGETNIYTFDTDEPLEDDGRLEPVLAPRLDDEEAIEKAAAEEAEAAEPVAATAAAGTQQAARAARVMSLAERIRALQDEIK
jgi:uncharacterized coiled-coil DUF342 family protein